MTAGPPRAQDVDRHVGALMRELHVGAGMTQQALADLIGVTCQHAQKYETGINRLAASRLYALAGVLRCEVGALLAGLEAPVAECARSLPTSGILSTWRGSIGGSRSRRISGSCASWRRRWRATVPPRLHSPEEIELR